MTLKEMAAAAVKAGYQPGNSWEHLLLRSLKRSQPELVRELGPNLQYHLQVEVHDAMELASRLEGQGTDPHTAKELAMHQLLGTEQ